METRTIGKEGGLWGKDAAHDPIDPEFVDSADVRAADISSYKAGGGHETPSKTVGGEINNTTESPAYVGSIASPNHDAAVMRYCQLKKKPTLSHYMYTALYTGRARVRLASGAVIHRTKKGQVDCFETSHFLFLAENKSRVMWIVRKRDMASIARVEDGILHTKDKL